MHAGRERNILRWDAHHALLTGRLEQVERTLAALPEPKGPRERERLESLLGERDELRRRLQALGPAPTPKMG
jgi:hypothetical protein